MCHVCDWISIGTRPVDSWLCSNINLDQKQECRILHLAIRIVCDKAPRGRECGVKRLRTTVVHPRLNN